MKEVWRKFRRDCRGAVTVFVTLLLIPAVLVSGTGVDLARVYTARSILQDANQLAANSALASYDALLQDLYGLFAIMKDDDEFATLMDKYIRVAVFGDGQKQGMGTFQLFYGSDLTPGEIEPARDQNLENPEVLRRQIEEYAKFRAPVIIINEILDRLDSFEETEKNGEIIQDKMDIEDKVEEIDELYREIYNCIQGVNSAERYEKEILGFINGQLKIIQQEIDGMYNARDSYTREFEAGNDEAAADFEKKYEGHFNNIIAIIKGGQFVSGWMPGNVDSNGNFQEGYWHQKKDVEGMEQTLEIMGDQLQWFLDNSSKENDSLADLKALCSEADQKKAELKRMVDDLERKLNEGECSEDLRKGMSEPQENGMSVIEQYRSLLGYELTPMAEAVERKATEQIQSFKDMLAKLAYTDTNNYSYSEGIWTLGSRTLDWVPIDILITQKTYPTVEDPLSSLDKIDPKQYNLPRDEGFLQIDKFRKFQDEAFSSTHNPEFYETLEKSYSKANDEEKDKIKDGVKQGLGKILKQIKDQFGKFLEFEPLGAYYFDNGANDSAGTDTTDFGQTGDWSDADAVKDQAKNALNSNLLSRISSAGNSAANKLLLLTYSSEMFSCYSTSGGEDGRELEETMNGIPMSVDVNYYFQSELEYLYNGNLRDARANLRAVTCMIFLVRFVMNYTASFMVPSVRKTVHSVETALAWTGPFAIVAGELTRLVLALGESVIDVSRLKSGAQVALFKQKDTWRFSISGQIKSIGSGTVDAVSEDQFDGGTDSDAHGLTYKDYIRLLLLLKDGNTLAQRTAKLIELNVTNKRDNIGGLGSREEREAAMSAASLFKMRNAVTGFSITTTVDLRMLFLSMPFAQKGVNGVVPPGKLEITATDYRGY